MNLSASHDGYRSTWPVARAAAGYRLRVGGDGVCLIWDWGVRICFGFRSRIESGVTPLRKQGAGFEFGCVDRFCGSGAACLVMVFKLACCAERRWRRLNGRLETTGSVSFRVPFGDDLMNVAELPREPCDPTTNRKTGGRSHRAVFVLYRTRRRR